MKVQESNVSLVSVESNKPQAQAGKLSPTRFRLDSFLLNSTSNNNRFSFPAKVSTIWIHNSSVIARPLELSHDDKRAIKDSTPKLKASASFELPEKGEKEGPKFKVKKVTVGFETTPPNFKVEAEIDVEY